MHSLNWFRYSNVLSKCFINLVHKNSKINSTLSLPKNKLIVSRIRIRVIFISNYEVSTVYTLIYNGNIFNKGKFWKNEWENPNNLSYKLPCYKYTHIRYLIIATLTLDQTIFKLVYTLEIF